MGNRFSRSLYSAATTERSIRSELLTTMLRNCCRNQFECFDGCFKCSYHIVASTCQNADRQADLRNMFTMQMMLHNRSNFVGFRSLHSHCQNGWIFIAVNNNELSICETSFKYNKISSFLPFNKYKQKTQTLKILIMIKNNAFAFINKIFCEHLIDCHFLPVYFSDCSISWRNL